MYAIQVDGQTVYACTDLNKYRNQCKKYASVTNAKFIFIAPLLGAHS